MSESFPQNITNSLTTPFQIESFGLYILKIVASCQSGDFLGFRGGQDLRIEIDDIKFREISLKDKPQYYNIPPAWNGTELRGFNKTIFFILPLDKGGHTLTYIPIQGAKIESFEIKIIENLQQIIFELNNKAKDGDKRPWYTFVFANLPLQSINADVSTSWHFWDGDNVKLIIDNQIEKNTQSKLWKNWIWSAKPWNIFSNIKRESKTFIKTLPSNIHYVEFWADKSPTIHQIIFDLGDFKLKRIPTVQDPEWTGDFNNDTDQILLARLILGEMEGQSKEAKIGAGFTVLNRLRKKRPNWGYSLKEIILKKNQYDAFVNKRTLKKVQDPLSCVSEKEWKNCFEIASQILSGILSDSTSGATHFYSTSTDTGFPSWATDDVFKIKIGITYFYELKS